jgi:hypothetical protein
MRTCSLHDRLGWAGLSWGYEVVIHEGGEKIGPRRGQGKSTRKPARRNSTQSPGIALGKGPAPPLVWISYRTILDGLDQDQGKLETTG